MADRWWIIEFNLSKSWVDLIFPSKPWASSVHLIWEGLVSEELGGDGRKQEEGCQVADSTLSDRAEVLVSGAINLTWDIVNIATIHKQVAILGVTQGR